MNTQDEQDLLAALTAAGIAIELTADEVKDYGLMVEDAVPLADALAAAADDGTEAHHG